MMLQPSLKSSLADKAGLVEQLCLWISDQYGKGPIIAAATVGVSILIGLLLHYVVLRGLAVLLSRTNNDVDERILAALRWPVIVSVVLGGCFVAVNLVSGPEATKSWGAEVGRGLLTLGLGMWTLLGMRISAILLQYASELSDRFPLIDLRTVPLFANLATVIVLSLALYSLLQIWEIDAAGWLASAGIVGVAVGFAAKDTLSNLFAGVFIVADGPYRLGDYIVLDDGVRGEVVHIGLRSTRVQTRSDVHITIPNSVIGQSKIVNQSGGGATSMRVAIPVGVGYDSDVDLVKKTLLDIGLGATNVCANPAPRVRFRLLGDSALHFDLCVWVPEPSLRGRVVDAILTRVVESFRELEIDIPFPQRTVHWSGREEAGDEQQ
ncbi:MAG: MscS family membrane protein [Planctomycetota bacterium]|jgi:MscS family membrane protein